MGFATFRGKHNANKAKVLLFLYEEADTGRWFRARELHAMLGIPLRSICTSLPRWCRWDKVRRRRLDGYFVYRIASDGLRWLERWYPYMPLKQYERETKAWQRRMKRKSKSIVCGTIGIQRAEVVTDAEK